MAEVPAAAGPEHLLLSCSSVAEVQVDLEADKGQGGRGGLDGNAGLGPVQVLQCPVCHGVREAFSTGADILIELQVIESQSLCFSLVQLPHAETAQGHGPPGLKLFLRLRLVLNAGLRQQNVQAVLKKSSQLQVINGEPALGLR